MKKFFADTFCFLALMNPRDQAHERTIQLLAELESSIFTTHWVLVEVGDAFCNPRERGLFKELLTLIESDARIRVISANKAAFARGVELYLQRNDKSWSLTDCISFIVMDQHSIVEALTADHHFEQAGFQPLLAETE